MLRGHYAAESNSFVCIAKLVYRVGSMTCPNKLGLSHAVVVFSRYIGTILWCCSNIIPLCWYDNVSGIVSVTVLQDTTAMTTHLVWLLDTSGRCIWKPWNPAIIFYSIVSETHNPWVSDSILLYFCQRKNDGPQHSLKRKWRFASLECSSLKAGLFQALGQCRRAKKASELKTAVREKAPCFNVRAR